MLKRLFLLLALAFAPLEDAHAACTASVAQAAAAAASSAPGRAPASEAAACPERAKQEEPATPESLNLRARLLESRFNRS